MSDSLEQFIEEVSGDRYLRIQDDLGEGFVRLRAAEAQRRQAQQDIRCFEDVVLEMLRNSRDAHARAIFVATWTEANVRNFTILDDGDGIPASMHEIVFEPFVTSKLDSFHADRWGVHGRGMALYSIRENVDSVSLVSSAPQVGAVFSVSASNETLTEKRDQSTLPSISLDADKKPVLRGPHNIVRTVIEFAIEERKNISVFFGSCASIVATLFHLGSSTAALTSVFVPFDDDTPYIERFSYCNDAESLAELSSSMALPISVRTAHRIMNGEIKPLPLIITALSDSQQTQQPQTLSRTNTSQKKDRNLRKIKFSSEDLASFKDAVWKDYSSLANQYYLDDAVDIDIRTRNNELIVRIPLQQQE